MNVGKPRNDAYNKKQDLHAVTPYRRPRTWSSVGMGVTPDLALKRGPLWSKPYLRHGTGTWLSSRGYMEPDDGPRFGRTSGESRAMTTAGICVGLSRLDDALSGFRNSLWSAWETCRGSELRYRARSRFRDRVGVVVK